MEGYTWITSKLSLSKKGVMQNPKEFKRSRLGEKGQSIVLIVLVMTSLLGITAVAVDGGRMYSERRNVQNAADNAALAAALERCNDTIAAPIIAAGLTSAAVNGFDNNGDTNMVTVNYPPQSGPNTGHLEHIEVIISSTQEASFAKVIFPNDLVVRSRAVARCRESFDYAVVALDTSNQVRGLQVVGNGDMIVNNGGVMVNSSHPTQALYGQGSGTLYSDQIHVNGGITDSGGFGTVPVNGVPPITDPLADLPVPAVPSIPLQSTPSAADTCTTSHGLPALDADFQGSSTITLNPGLYCGITGDSNVNFILNPGIYYIDGPGGFTVTASSTISGTGVMIYMSPTAAAVQMQGNANVNISAATSGPYAGMLFFADRNYTQNIAMTGNANWNAVGTIYAAGSFLDLSGNGAVNNLSSMLVAKTIKMGGSSNVVVNYDPGLNVTPPSTISLVE